MAFSRFNESINEQIVKIKRKGYSASSIYHSGRFHNATTIGDSLVHWNGYASTNTCNSSSWGIRQRKVWFIKRKGVVDIFIDKLHEETEGVNFIPIRSRYCTGQNHKKSRQLLFGWI